MKTSNHLLRRLTAALLAAVLALSIALPVFASDDGDTIYINSVSDLLSLARNCAYDQWSVGKTVILQKDLSLEGMLWEPSRPSADSSRQRPHHLGPDHYGPVFPGRPLRHRGGTGLHRVPERPRCRVCL